ncbi:hypothetical protein EH11_01733 [Bacillus subtilis]|uniref:hypothetical protein n=1 Tax=Bacillus subtilis group TaxID=653685 RepID=UPI000F53D9C6|nr:hypothetical protein [Bacillus subtilis]RPK02403.1 hypothetical protein EH11_01733 [Bacillus subtilis]RUS08610.1 hypothetical protein EFW59_01738 [Bacillus subtilis]
MHIATPLDAKELINKEIPLSVRRHFVPLVQNGYDLVTECMKKNTFLQWSIGERHRGYLDHIAVEYVLRDAAQSGTLGLKSSIIPNSNRSALHLELESDNLKITVSRTSSKFKTARSAKFRSMLQKSNQLYWTEDYEIKEEPGYLQLTHGNDNGHLVFANLGIPDNKGGWYDFIDLTKEINLIKNKNIEENKIKPEQLVGFKNFAQGVLKVGGSS